MKAIEEAQDRLFVKHVYPNGDVVVKEPIYNFDSELLEDENYLLTFAKPTEQYVYDNYKVGPANPFGWTDYTLTINYKEKAPEQKNINVQVSIDNDAAGTITSSTDFTLTVNEGEKASVTVTWDLNYRYRTDSITINGVEIDLSSSDRSYTFETEDDTVVVVNTYRSSTPVGPTDPDTDPDEEINDDATPEVGNKDDVTDTGVASTMPWMVASLVSLGAMVAELIRRNRR